MLAFARGGGTGGGVAVIIGSRAGIVRADFFLADGWSGGALGISRACHTRTVGFIAVRSGARAGGSGGYAAGAASANLVLALAGRGGATGRVAAIVGSRARVIRATDFLLAGGGGSRAVRIRHATVGFRGEGAAPAACTGFVLTGIAVRTAGGVAGIRCSRAGIVDAGCLLAGRWSGGTLGS